MAAISISDLNNAKVDADFIAEVATSPNHTARDRLGRVKNTLAGAIAELQIINRNRGDWVTGTEYEQRDLFTRAGVAYLVTAPYVSGDFAEDVDSGKFIIFQGVPNIGPALDAAIPGSPIKQYANAEFIFDGESTSLSAADGPGWPEFAMGMSSFAGRGAGHVVAVAGRNMAGTFAAYNANVRPKIQAAKAAGRAVFVFLWPGLNDYGLGPVTYFSEPFDHYVSAVEADGGILVPMLTTRRMDWSAHEGVRRAINDHMLALGNPLTIRTDSIFTDPSFVVGSGVVAQSSDGTHPNVAMRLLIATVVNQVMAAGAGFAHMQYVQQVRALAGSQIPYTNALGQLATDNGLALELSTNGNKDFLLALLNSFPQAGKTGIRFGTPGAFKAWEIATVGDTSDLSPELARCLVFMDLFTNLPLMALSTYQQGSWIYGKFGLRRSGPASPVEPVYTGVAYPAASNSPGSIGQIAYNPAKTKIAIYSGDGINSHSWVVAEATSSV